jgi:hypothetical protein
VGHITYHIVVQEPGMPDVAIVLNKDNTRRVLDDGQPVRIIDLRAGARSDYGRAGASNGTACRFGTRPRLSFATMKVLLLGTSDDAADYVAEAATAPRLAEAELTRRLGEPVEIVLRRVWPTERFPRLVDRWLNDEKPDVVVLRTAALWVSYESVPVRVERILGPLGGPVRRLGIRMAQTPVLGTNPGFHASRKWLQRTIGGDPFFTVEQVVDSIGAAIRRIVRDERVVLVVRGPQGANRYHSSERAARNGERRRAAVHVALRDLCRQLHVHYEGVDRGTKDADPATKVGDRIHSNEEGQRRRAAILVDLIETGWRRHQEAHQGASPAR